MLQLQAQTEMKFAIISLLWVVISFYRTLNSDNVCQWCYIEACEKVLNKFEVF